MAIKHLLVLDHSGQENYQINVYLYGRQFIRPYKIINTLDMGCRMCEIGGTVIWKL
jgi:hypothetical protein